MSEAQPTSPVSPEADNSGDIYNPVLRTIASQNNGPRWYPVWSGRCCTAAQHSASAWWLMAYSTGMPPA